MPLRFNDSDVTLRPRIGRWHPDHAEDLWLTTMNKYASFKLDGWRSVCICSVFVETDCFACASCAGKFSSAQGSMLIAIHKFGGYYVSKYSIVPMLESHAYSKHLHASAFLSYVAADSRNTSILPNRASPLSTIPYEASRNSIRLARPCNSPPCNSREENYLYFLVYFKTSMNFRFFTAALIIGSALTWTYLFFLCRLIFWIQWLPLYLLRLSLFLVTLSRLYVIFTLSVGDCFLHIYNQPAESDSVVAREPEPVCARFQCW